MKSILITGAAGFKGSHLTDFFLSKHFNVIGIDNLMTGSYQNLDHVMDNNRFKFIEHDICEEFNLDEKLDYILHFASPASPKDYLKNPIMTLKIGSIGTENILNLGLLKKARVIVASTSEIYGDPLVHPQSESYFGNVNPIGPRSAYDEAKRYLEAITIAYKNFKKLNVGIARIFNTYGPRMKYNDGRAIPNFITQAIGKKELTIYGDGNQTRSFCYIDDTVRGIYKLTISNYNLPVNIGNDQELSINELVNNIKLLLNSTNEIVFENLPENDPKFRKPDIELAKSILNWEPKVNLRDGLKKTISYFENLSNFKK